MINSLIAALRDIGLEPTAEEVGDVIWLAYHVGPMRMPNAPGSGRAKTLPTRDPAPNFDAQRGSRGPERQIPQDHEEPSSLPPDSESQLSGGLYTWPSGGRYTAVGPGGIPFRSPGARALPGALELGRALRPLMRRVGSRTKKILDEVATINRVAEERIWSPVSRPAPTRWLEAALVIDEGASMNVWRETIKEFTRLLEVQGAFRDVRTWRLNTDLRDGQVSLRVGANRLLRNPTELIDPSGRRIIIIITDCVSPAWDSDGLTTMLAEWGRHHPVAILQMLPQKLWAQTSLYRARSVRVRPSRPGQPNALLVKEIARTGRKPFDGVPIPVFTLEPTPAATWARLVAGLTETRAPAFLLSTIGAPLPRLQQSTAAAEPTADERLGMFRARISTTAFELARLLAAAPLTLPVMRLIQRVMLPESRQVHLAEVFLGGVLCRVSSGADDTEEVRYDFLPGLRELLLDSAQVPDSVSVIKIVSSYLEERVGQSLDFAAILADPEAVGNLTVDDNNREFARIGAEVLRRLGGRYNAVAERLVGMSSKDSQPKPEPELPEKTDNVAELIEEAFRTAATSLDLSSMGLTEVPERVLELHSLRNLNLSRNKLTELPASVGRLVELRVLDVSHNQLATAPWSLVDLPQLEELHLTHNRLNRVPSDFGRLSYLRHLCLNHNKLRNLPAKLGELVGLEQLELSGNKLSSLPDSLGRLSSLRELRLDKNNLSSLPNSLLKLQLLEKLYLHNNEALGIPTELLGGDPDAVYLGLRSPARPQQILDYYFEQTRGLHRVYEAKVVLVGPGGAGKTSIVNRLVGDHFRSTESVTHGLQMSELQVSGPEGEAVRLHFWDFGGQDVYHSINQFFFTKHSLYLLVLNGRENVDDVGAEYWLQLIRGRAGEAPVIVVLNRSAERAFEVDRRGLQQKYPFIREFVVTDCATELGIAKLRQSITSEVGQMENWGVMLPQRWFAVKNSIAALKVNQLSPDAFAKLCVDNGVTDSISQNAIADYLHNLGIILWFREDRALSEICVLNPVWLTDAVGSILDWVARSKQDALVRVGNLKEVLESRRYPKRTHQFFLDLMARFELCFNSPADTGVYLIPELLDAQSPMEISEFNPEECLNFRYQYEAVPLGLLPRLIVRTSSLSERLPRWRTGVILEFEGCRALVTSDTQYKRISISIKGRLESRRPLLAKIRKEFEQIHKQAGILHVRELVPLPGRPDITVPYDELLRYELTGQTNVIIPNVDGDITVAVRTLLYGDLSHPSKRRKLFGIDGIRARAGEFPLDPATVRVVGGSLAKHLQEQIGHRPRIVIGRDTRDSGSSIEEALAEGARSAGAAVECCGVITTPGVAFLARSLPADAGVVISASHSPYQDNGIKIFAPSGRKLADATERRIEADVAEGRFRTISLPETDTTTDGIAASLLREKYFEHLRRDVAGDLSLRDLKIVIDCANGAASELAPRLFNELGASVTAINNQPDGRNINLNCGSLHIEGLQRRVVDAKADIGVAFDGDADRALFVDEAGNLVDGDSTMWVLANEMHSRGELNENLVVSTVMANLGLEVALRAQGISLVRTDVGDKYVLDELLRSAAVLGGEQSGHIIFPGISLAGDGMITAINLLRVMRGREEPLSRLVQGFARFPQVLVNVRVREKRPFDEVPLIREAASAVESKLGERGRLLLRYSGTEPLARVMIEGEREDLIKTCAEDLGSAIRRALGETQSTDAPEEPLESKKQQLITFASLSDALSGALESDSSEEVVDVTHDSRQAKEGFLFAAVRGELFDAHKFIPQVMQQGAAGVISESERPANFTGAWIQVANIRRAMAVAAAEVHHHPSRELKLVGITGTNGKTTCAYLIASIPEAAGEPVAMTGTVEYRLGKERKKAGRTTPEATDMQRLLRQAVQIGCKSAVMECSSQAMDLHRCDELDYEVAVFTNLTRDHLDYHKTMENYWYAKQRLFDGRLGSRPKTSVINVDDAHGVELASRLKSEGLRVVTYAVNAPADVTAREAEFSLSGMQFRLDISEHAGGVRTELDFHSPLVGPPHVYNALAAVASGLALGYPLDVITKALEKCTGAPGRFERVAHGGDFAVVVDYAHSDDALLNVLRTARDVTKGRIITVFGCGGDRDRSKRAPMGEAAGSLSHVVILTSDNPRTEDPNQILGDAEEGIRKTGKPYEKIADRREAIHHAIAQATSGDLVLIAGKGHEDYQIIGREVFHFDDREVALEGINMRLRASGRLNSYNTNDNDPKLSFDDHCIVDENSIRNLSNYSGPSSPTIDWHYKIQNAVALAQRWQNQHAELVKLFPWYSSLKGQEKEQNIATNRNQVEDHNKKLVEVIDENQNALRKLIRVTESSPHNLRAKSIRTFGALAALRVIFYLQGIEPFIVNDQGAHFNFFADISRRPSSLLELVPSRSEVGAMIFNKDFFLRARVGRTESTYEYLVLPKDEAERLHKDAITGDIENYYSWILPQWLLYSFPNQPDAHDWAVWVLIDELGREAYLPSSNRPWDVP